MTHSLNKNKSYIISPTLPFHFNGTFHKPSHFPDKLSDWEPGKYWQALRIDHGISGIKIEDQKPALKVTVYSQNKTSDKVVEEIKNEITWRFGLNEDLSEFNKLAQKDKRFYPVFKKWLGMRVSSAHSLYELMIISVLLQNATVRRTVQMMKVLLEKYGTKVEFDGKEIYALWQPKYLENVSEEELRALKIGYRAKFIKRLSDDFMRGIIDEKKLRTLDKESAKDELMKLYGVGPETARILLFEALHHYDTFEHIAPWQQKIYSRLFYNKMLVPVEKIRDDIIKTYGKYSMLAVHYIWEDIFWKRAHAKHAKIEWLEKEIRL